MKAFFRCDATTETGFGHMSRCIALAEAFRQIDIPSSFIGLFDHSALQQLSAAGFDCTTCENPLNGDTAEMSTIAHLLAQSSGSFLVVDSYRADDSYLAKIRPLSTALVIFDDFQALQDYPCDVIVNFTWAAGTASYPHGPITLLGPGYFPARRRLVELRAQSLERTGDGTVDKVLIAIGGSDPQRIAARIARLLRRHHSRLTLRVVDRNADEELADIVTGFSPSSCVLANLPDLAEQMLWADACIAGGGLTKYEAAFLGVPVATIAQNKGQTDESRTLAAAGLVFDLGLSQDRDDAQVEAGIDRFLADGEIRGKLSKRSRREFPDDPGTQTARAIIEILRGLT